MTSSPIPALDAIPDDVRELAAAMTKHIVPSSVGYREARALIARAIMADRANHTARADVAEVGIKEMKLSDGRIDYFVSIQVGGREITPYKFSERWKAELEVAAFRHVFFNEPEVDYAAFGHAPSQGDSA